MQRLPCTTALMCFEAAARLGSFTRAAAEIHLTQAAVSRRVIGLERRLGVRLLLRQRDALALTDAGRAYLDSVRTALRSIEQTTAAVMALEGQGGRLRLSVASSLGNYWLTPRLPEFTREHPQITLDIATRVGAADFGGGQIDASLEFGDGQRAGLVSEAVMPLELSRWAAQAWVRRHGKRLDAATPSAALIHQTAVPEAWPQSFKAARVIPPARIYGPRHDLMSMALDAALAGLGVALLPPFMTHDAHAARRLVRLSPVVWRAAHGYWLVVRPAAAERAAVMTLRQWLLRQALI